MKKILVALIGKTDLRAVTESSETALGPIAQAVQSLPFDEITLLCDCSPQESNTYFSWLYGIKPIKATIQPVTLSSPTNFRDIYHAAVEAIQLVRNTHGDSAQLTFHLSPGTPAMAAVWILLAKTLYPATLIQSSREHGVQIADIPFDISAEFIPKLAQANDERLERMIASLPPESPEFDDIIHRSPVMQRVIARSRMAAARTVPVLIEQAVSGLISSIALPLPFCIFRRCVNGTGISDC